MYTPTLIAAQNKEVLAQGRLVVGDGSNEFHHYKDGQLHEFGVVNESSFLDHRHKDFHDN